jgi:hypothetical protein
MYTIVKNDNIDKEAWDKFLELSPMASWFQSYSCYQFYCQLSFLTPFVYAVESVGQLKGLVCGYLIAEGGVIKSKFSRRAIIPGGALFSNDISTEVVELLLVGLKTELQHKTIYVEFRNLNNYSTYKDVFQRIGFKYKPHLNFHIDLTTVDEVFSKLSDSKKRQVRQTLKAGVSYEMTRRAEDITEFYKILSELYQNKIKLPLFPVEFFEKIIKDSMGQLIVLKENAIVLGGILCVVDKNTVYEWFVCGLDQRTQKIYPSALATWAGIKHAIDEGCSRFDFMGAGKPDRDYGVRDFKARFGGDLVEHGRFIYIFKPVVFNLAKWYLKFYKKYF